MGNKKVTATKSISWPSIHISYSTHFNFHIIRNPLIDRNSCQLYLVCSVMVFMKNVGVTSSTAKIGDNHENIVDIDTSCLSQRH
jgi:hypothetical protein